MKVQRPFWRNPRARRARTAPELNNTRRGGGRQPRGDTVNEESGSRKPGCTKACNPSEPGSRESEWSAGLELAEASDGEPAFYPSNTSRRQWKEKLTASDQLKAEERFYSLIIAGKNLIPIFPGRRAYHEPNQSRAPLPLPTGILSQKYLDRADKMRAQTQAGNWRNAVQK